MSKATTAASAAQQPKKLLPHGHAFEKWWKEHHPESESSSVPPQPKCVSASEVLARPGYSQRDASEYVDSDAVLDAKVDFLLHKMWLPASHPVLYTGAGLSTAAGIGDYASKASGSLVKTSDNMNRLQLPPTHAHRVIAAMHKKNHLACIIDQNHDNLHLKAGMPLDKVNAVHGRWLDNHNCVKMMDDRLTPFYIEWIMHEAATADFCLVVGSSLSGMTADTVAEQVARRDVEAHIGKGTAILSLQETGLQQACALKIYARIETVFQMIQTKMKLKLDSKTYDVPRGTRPPKTYTPPVPAAEGAAKPAASK